MMIKHIFLILDCVEHILQYTVVLGDFLSKLYNVLPDAGIVASERWGV